MRCRICGCLSGAHIDRCVSCGGAAIEVIEDVVEFGLEQALQQKAALQLVRSEAARRLMTRVGPMGAILRWQRFLLLSPTHQWLHLGFDTLSQRSQRFSP